MDVDFLLGAFSPNQLKALHRISLLHSYYLRKIMPLASQNNIQRQRVYLLDYQEIGSYLYPFKRPSLVDDSWLDYVSIRYLIESENNLRFYIPDGTLYELNQLFISIDKPGGGEFVLKDNYNIQHSHFDYLTFHSGESFLKSLDKLTFDTRLPTNEIAWSLTQSYKNLDPKIGNLSTFFKRSGIKNLEELGIINHLANLDLDLAELFMELFRVIVRTGNRRKRKAENNIVDTLNIIWSLIIQNQPSNATDFDATLVTHTDALFNAYPKLKEVVETKYGLKFPNFWSPSTVVYSMIIENANESNDHWFEEALGVCRQISKNSRPLLNRAELASSDAQYSDDFSFMLEMDKERLSANYEEFKPFFKYALDPFADVLHRFEEFEMENYNFDSDKLAKFPRLQTTFSRSMFKISSKFSFYLAKAKCRIKKIGKVFKDIFRSTDLNLVELTKGEVSIDIFSFYQNAELQTKPYRKSFGLRKNEYDGKFLALQIDKYEGFSSIYWKTALALYDVVAEINDLIQNDEIKILGLILHSVRQEGLKTIPNKIELSSIKPPIRLDKIRELTENEKVTFLRLDTEVGDFCYYASSIEGVDYLYPTAGRLIGVLAKEEKYDVISTLFSSTSYEAIKEEWIERFLQTNAGKIVG